MRALVAYSKPRGYYGLYYVVTVIAEYETSPKSTESISFRISRPNGTTYSCNSCGHFGSVRVVPPTVISATETKTIGTLEFTRFDNVELGDRIDFTFKDEGLAFF